MFDFTLGGGMLMFDTAPSNYTVVAAAVGQLVSIKVA